MIFISDNLIMVLQLIKWCGGLQMHYEYHYINIIIISQPKLALLALYNM